MPQVNPEIVDLSYQAAVKSYEIIIQRIDAAQTRIQRLLSLSCGVTFAIPVVVEHFGRTSCYSAELFITIGLIFAGTVLAGVWDWAWPKPVSIVNPKILMNWDFTDPIEFKREFIRQSAEHLKKNNKRVHRHTRVASLMCLGLFLEILVFGLWALPGR